MAETKKSMCICAVRIRGTTRASAEARETLQMLQLARNNHAVLIDNRPSFLGMLKTAQHFVTWGEPSKETVNALMKKRGRLMGNKKLTGEYAQTVGFKTLDELTEAVYDCRIAYSKLPKIQPTLRLHPPTKGFKRKVKKGYRAGGESGYRGEKINELVKRMF